MQIGVSWISIYRIHTKLMILADSMSNCLSNLDHLVRSSLPSQPLIVSWLLTRRHYIMTMHGMDHLCSFSSHVKFFDMNVPRLCRCILAPSDWMAFLFSLNCIYTIGCIEFLFYSIFIWLTVFSLYFLILRTIYFLTFCDLRTPSFAKFTFCKVKFSNKAVGPKLAIFLSKYFLGTNKMPL